MIVKHRGLFVAGWSPTHQQPICVQREIGAKRWPDPEGFRFWYSRQPGSSNYGPVEPQFEFVTDTDPIHRAIDKAKADAREGRNADQILALSRVLEDLTGVPSDVIVDNITGYKGERVIPPGADLTVIGVDLASGEDRTVFACPTCRTQLAFDGDVCGLCHPDGTPEL